MPWQVKSKTAYSPFDGTTKLGLFRQAICRLLWLEIGVDLSTAKSASDYIVCETMPDMAPSASPACEAVVSIGCDRLTTAARVRSDQRGPQTQPHRQAKLIISQAEPKRAGWEGLQPGAGSFCLDRQQPGASGRV